MAAIPALTKRTYTDQQNVHKYLFILTLSQKFFNCFPGTNCLEWKTPFVQVGQVNLYVEQIISLDKSS